MRTSRFKLRTNVVNLGDDAGLRWVSLIPEGPIHARGMVWRFDADETDVDRLEFNFDDAVESLQRWLADFAPAIAIEHETDGSAAGYLRAIRVLDRAEAARHGIRQPASRMVYGGLDITSPRWAARFDAGEVPYVSPNIRAHASTERDAAPAYPFAIGEVSFVTIPQVKAQQVPVADMRGISLNEESAMAMAMSKEDLAAYCADNGMDATAIDALIGQLFQAVHDEAHNANPDLADGALDVIAEGLEHAITGKTEEEEEASKDAETPLGEVRRLRAALATERNLRALDAVRKDLGGRKVSAAAEALLAQSYLKDRKQYEVLLRDFGHAARTAPTMAGSTPAATSAARAGSPRLVAPVARHATQVSLKEALTDGARFDALSDDDQWALITELADKEKCNHWQAASWIKFGRMPDSVREDRNNGRTTR